MNHSLTLPPDLLASLRAQSPSPWTLGHSIGILLYHISPLVSTHLDNPISFSNPMPSKLAGYESFVTAVDQHLAKLRLADDLPHALSTNDRKEKAKRKKYVERYTKLVEVSFKACIRDSLNDIFAKYGKKETKSFNTGVDKALSGVQWVEYPSENVVYAAGEGAWAEWLRRQCESLGMERAKAGRKVLEDM